MKKMKLGILTLSIIAFGTINAQSERQEKERKSPTEIFAKKDFNSDGFIDRVEFSKAIEMKRQRAAEKGKEFKDVDVDKKFMQADLSRDGKISLEEFTAEYNRRMAKKDNPRRKFESADLNGNESIDYTEFRTAMEKRAAKAEAKGKEPRNMDPRKAFAKIDRDNSGSITYLEFQASKEAMQKRRSEKEEIRR